MESKGNITQLSDKELEEAKKVLLQSLKFPVRRRKQVDEPIPGQHVANVSFELLPTPKQGIYGFVTIRGNWPDKQTAYEKAVDILRVSDTTRRIIQVPVGVKIPITSDPRWFTETIDVDTQEDDESEEASMRKQILNTMDNKKKKEEETAKAKIYMNKMKDDEEEVSQLLDKMEEVSIEAEKRARREEKEYIEQVKKNQEEAIEAGKRDDDPESLESYVRARVTERDIVVYKLPQLVSKYLSMKSGLQRVQDARKRLEKAYPHYKNEWLDLYNTELGKSGIDQYSPECFEFMGEFVDMLTSFDLDKERFDEIAERASKRQNIPVSTEKKKEHM